GFQLGADLLFWWQLGQELKGVIAADQYIPALRYRALPQKGKKQPHFELYPSWEIVSERYEALVRRYAACMPAVCAAGSESAGRTDLFEPESLLRHFAEHRLHRAVHGTPRTAALDNQLSGTILESCVRGTEPIPGSDQALE